MTHAVAGNGDAVNSAGNGPMFIQIAPLIIIQQGTSDALRSGKGQNINFVVPFFM
jgi:hypothetical protein